MPRIRSILADNFRALAFLSSPADQACACGFGLEVPGGMGLRATLAIRSPMTRSFFGAETLQSLIVLKCTNVGFLYTFDLAC